MASIASRWQIGECLGQGGMGQVFRATSQGPVPRLAAMKRVRPELAADAGFARVFLAEVRLAARLRHPAFVEVLDVDEADGQLYLAMELVDGASLARLLTAAQSLAHPMPPGLVAWLGWELADALATAHALCDDKGSLLGLVHRDVSPENIMLSPSRLALLDFGIAKATLVLADERTRTDFVKGKASYVSPEQADGRPIDGRSDVFSLGSVLYECLAGERAFRGVDALDTLRLVRLAAPRPLVGVDSELTAALEALMAPDLTRRPTASQARTLLRPIMHRLVGDPETMARWLEPLWAALPAPLPPSPTLPRRSR